MLNLVMIGPYPQDPSRVERGVEAVTVNLVEGLKRIENLNMQVISCTQSVYEEKSYDIGDVKVHFLPSARRFGNITLGVIDRLTVRRKLKELSPDIIHNQYHFAYPYLFSKPEVPAITTVHGITFKEAPYENENLDWLRRLPRLWLERMVLRNVDQAICVSEYVRETIAPLTQANLYVVENPVSSRYFQAENREVPNRILFAGAIIRRKNILDLLKAVNILRHDIDVDFHIVGVAEERYYYEILREYVRENKLEKYVTFCGTLSDGELLREYEECCIVVLPSFEESAGMVLQQAMAAGKPVVATRIGGIPCIVKDNATGFLTELGDIRELAEKIQILLGDRQLRVSMGRKGHEEALARFRPEFIGKMTFEVYRKVLGK